MKKIRDLVLAYTLQNAVFYNGKANAGAVMGKVLAARPELKKDMEGLKKEIEKSVNEVNRLGVKRQKEMLKGLSEGMLSKEEKKQEDLPPLRSAGKGMLVTRFAPSPTGPLNIGQLLRAVMLPYIYVKKYKGKFILRIEDTDPRNIEKKFYRFIAEDLLSAGVKWDRMVKESDHMDLYYRTAEDLISAGDAYVCTCSAEKFRSLKLKKTPCGCRKGGPGSNVDAWKKMLSGGYGEGEAVLRLKTSMKDANPVMRDPPLLRITDAPHPLKGTKYRVWPLYNFACVVMDHLLEITHVFRGKEHEHNTAVQERVYSMLGWDFPAVINYGMIYLPGTKMHTRDMKRMVEEKKASGWDDPVLPTVRALLRRGFQPKALLEFAKVCGMSKTDIRVGWENVEGINRKMIDPLSNRFMVVLDPVTLSVKNPPAVKEVREHVHPDFPARGKRVLPVDFNSIRVSGDDWKKLSGKKIRLKGLGNVLLKKESEYAGNDIVAGMPKIQWVSEPNVAVTVLTPEGKLSGLGETNLKKLKTGTLIQMERIGFGMVDSAGENGVVIAFAHR